MHLLHESLHLASLWNRGLGRLGRSDESRGNSQNRTWKWKYPAGECVGVKKGNEVLVHRSTAMNARVFETIKARSPVMYAHFLILFLNNHQNWILICKNSKYLAHLPARRWMRITFIRPVGNHSQSHPSIIIPPFLRGAHVAQRSHDHCYGKEDPRWLHVGPVERGGISRLVRDIPSEGW